MLNNIIMKLNQNLKYLILFYHPEYAVYKRLKLIPSKWLQ